MSRRTKPYRLPDAEAQIVRQVDRELPTPWLDRLNRLPGVEVCSTCAGHPAHAHVGALVDLNLAARVPRLPPPAGLRVTLKEPDERDAVPNDPRPWLWIERGPDAPAWWLHGVACWLEALVWSPRWRGGVRSASTRPVRERPRSAGEMHHHRCLTCRGPVECRAQRCASHTFTVCRRCRALGWEARDAWTP
jgi:hypothetical protein